MLESLPIGVSLWNAVYEIVDCNQSAMGMFGFDTKDKFVEHFLECIPESQANGENSSDSIPKYLQETFDTGYKRFEWMFKTIFGEPMPVEVTLIRVPINNEFMVAAYKRDLSEIKSIQARAREAEDRTQIMLDTTPLCASFWHHDHHNIDCNLAAVKLFDLKDKNEYLDRFFELSPEFQPDGSNSTRKAHELLDKAFEEGYCQFEWLHQKLDGELIPAEITLIRAKHRNDYIVVGYTKDLRKLKATEARLREAEERTRLMLDTTPLCANFWNKDFQNIDCNLAAVKLFDLKDKNEYLDRFFELSPEYQPDGKTSAESSHEKIVKAFEEGFCKFEWLHQKLNGELIETEITLIRAQHRGEYMVAGYTKDLRELKATEARVREAEERTQIMLDATPLCANFWNKEFKNIDCNLAAVKLFGLKNKQ